MTRGRAATAALPTSGSSWSFSDWPIFSPRLLGDMVGELRLADPPGGDLFPEPESDWADAPARAVRRVRE
jgi:hypothetical protein